MYESITAYLPKLYNELVALSEEGTITNSKMLLDFEDSVYSFIDNHKEMELNRYSEILKESGIDWEMESMKSANVEALEGRTVMALIIGAIRADRFCEGALQEFFVGGEMEKWLKRLKSIDDVCS